LSSFDQATQLAAVFDQYMIESVEIWIMPQFSNASTSNFSGTLLSVIDLDDNNVLSTVAQASDYTSCVTTEVDQGHYRHFVPHVALAAYSGAFSSFANRHHMWIDAASPSVQHYGVKLAASPTGAVCTYDVNIRATLRFRSIR